MKAIVTGMIGTYGIGGVLWDYGQYALGLERLGFEVYYLEDTGLDAYDPRRGEYGTDCSHALAFLNASLSALSPALAKRWRFRCVDGSSHGMADEVFDEVLRTADLFLNVSGSALLRDEYLGCRRKVLIDSDPGWNHFRNFPRWDAHPSWHGSHGFRAHDFFFTYAELIGRAGCVLPTFDLHWRPTRPLAVLDCWQAEPPNRIWTTVMTWKNYQEPIEYRGIRYGTKELEFGKIEALPAQIKAPLQIAAGGASPPRERWESLGWSLIAATDISATADSYRHYVQQSRGEFSVAKNVYVATRSGWFSCRSACYLAAGLPVVVQDTGFSELIPSGEGLLSFTDLQGAVSSIETVEKSYARHCRAAREIAHEFFASEVVLGDLLRQIGL